jgi:hypothetical protein
MIHVLVVPAMKERQLLRAVRRVIGAVEIEHEIRGVLIGPIGVGAEPVDSGAREALNRGPLDRVLQPRERRLRPQGRAAIPGDHLERRILTEPVGVVDVFVACGDLIQPLADERVQLVRDVAPVARVGEAAHHIRTEAELPVERSHEQQAGIRRERAPREIDDEFRLESKAKLRITVCSHRPSLVAIPSRLESPRTYHDSCEGDGIFMHSFVNYPG